MAAFAASNLVPWVRETLEFEQLLLFICLKNLTKLFFSSNTFLFQFVFIQSIHINNASVVYKSQYYINTCIQHYIDIVSYVDVETLHGHKDYEQVILDVKRSMKRFPPGFILFCGLLMFGYRYNCKHISQKHYANFW